MGINREPRNILQQLDVTLDSCFALGHFIISNADDRINFFSQYFHLVINIVSNLCLPVCHVF